VIAANVDVGKPGAFEEKQELGREVHAHGEGVFLGGDEAAVVELLGPDLEDERLVERVDLSRTRVPNSYSLPSAARLRSPDAGHGSGSRSRSARVHRGQRRMLAHGTSISSASRPPGSSDA
jgi:hypothetical protein